MTKRRILGIDPGTGILGFGVVDCEIGKPIKMITGGVISTPAHTPIEIRLEEIYNGLKEIITETKPDEVSIEKLFFSKNDHLYSPGIIFVGFVPVLDKL